MARGSGRLRILVVTRSYPSDGNLYQYPFVHRRVLAYRAAGHAVAVFRPADQRVCSEHRFDGVTCRAGDCDALSAFADTWRPDVVASHGFSETQWHALEPLAGRYPIRAWLHGSEIPEIARRKAHWDTVGTVQSAALATVEQRCDFWRQFLADMPELFRLVFVSEAAVELARKDWGPMSDAAIVIHNPIDTDLFRYQLKASADRFNILMIRPFDSYGYGNDLAVSAIRKLADRSGFERLRFTIVGDGPLFDQTLEPIRHLENVSINRGFLTQPQIAEQHRHHGIFLVPTRIDTQGVSRDEAMSSGLVPVTNRVPAVDEFLNGECGVVAPAEDAAALAEGIWEMIEDPELFGRRSIAAANRVRGQSGSDRVIPQELALLRSAVHA
jgi:glycosyltransferase involved in cell wall biosynthesis